jgi:hypothetical protein
MARSIATIKQQIQDEKNALSEISSIKFKEEGGSKVGKANAWAYIYAVLANVLEQLWDLMKSNIEASISKAGAGTLPWLRERILEFQSGDNVSYADGIVSYATLNTDKRIITRCSVSQDGNRVVKAKVAKSEPPTALTTGEKNELKYYLEQVQFAGTQIEVISDTSDKLFVEGEVFYDGQFAESIEDSVIEALNNYCTNLSSSTNFNGLVTVNGVEDAIQSVEGVINVKLEQVAVRPNATPFASRTIIFDLSTGVNDVLVETNAGYVIQETTSGQTFADQLTFTLG